MRTAGLDYYFPPKGLEVAAFGIGKGAASSVHVVGQSPTPFARVFGAAIGARMTKVCIVNSKFICGTYYLYGHRARGFEM